MRTEILILTISLLSLTTSIYAKDFITYNCRLYCNQNFNFCFDKINSENRRPKEYHRMKNTCYVKKQQCHEKCTKQEISLKENKSYQEFLKSKTQFTYKNWFPYKKVNLNEERFDPKKIIEGVRNE